ncbi:coiled-coil domain-containing protein 170 isoform X4 [Anopheles gambiae]|uniref:coiled-coil domain-containing protein 170 isoform X4 n=1 Tax=Anopheles coluzzii TaxID=1518534 RepID=UPI001AADD706|nr:coiled-coil domain-containing protein 170 isoform X4 [Anopheles coluzzii]XP_061509187.1 coiled-coil domain-containing protein 170 isoform X4 [Anopheles gambiae]
MNQTSNSLPRGYHRNWAQTGAPTMGGVSFSFRFRTVENCERVFLQHRSVVLITCNFVTAARSSMQNSFQNMPKHHTPHSPVHHHHHPPPPSCNDHLAHSIDLATTLRSELAASTYKRDRLMAELSDVKSSLCSKESECESLRAQSARQTSLIGSLQQRLAAAEQREKTLHSRSETVMHTLHRDKSHLEDKIKELSGKLHRLQCELTKEEGLRDQARCQLQDLVRRLCLLLGVDVCDGAHLTPECVLAKTGETVSEVQRLRAKLAGTCENLSSTESELLSTKAAASAEKTRLHTQIEGLQSLAQSLEGRCRQAERDLQVTRDRLAECEVTGDKLREELRGFESRCCRLQNSYDRLQTERLQFLRTIATIVGVSEPCENNLRDKIRDLTNHSQALHDQVSQLREQHHQEAAKHREHQEASACRLKGEEQHRMNLEDRLEKACHELQHFRSEHTTLSEYLLRLARALCWSECTEPPAPGSDTTILSETLLERAERLANHHEHHIHGTGDKTERDEAMHKARKNSKQAERTTQQLAEVKAQLAEVKHQLTEASEYKITALERARKCDELQARLCDLETERERLVGQLASYKSRARSAVETSHDRRVRDEHAMSHLREELSRVKLQLADTNHRLSQLQVFRTSVAKLLHVSDCADSEILQKLQSVCSDHGHHHRHHRHHSASNLSNRRYDSSPPSGEAHVSRYDDILTGGGSGATGSQSIGCRPLSSSPVHNRRYIDSGFNDHDHHFEDDFDFHKKY